jgi:hypothetical protein
MSETLSSPRSPASCETEENLGMNESHGALQESEYSFPYHYLAHFQDDVPSTRRSLFWGWEYLTYMDHLVR